MHTKIWAHRGASAYAPENTLPAFILAAEQKADAVELDIQLTKDQELVVIHDEKVNRVSDGSGYVKDFTLKELKKLNVNKKFKKYGSVTIPTLEEVYELVHPTGMQVNVEFKTGRFLYKGIEEKALELAEKMRMKDQVIYSSFNHFTLERLKKADPSVQTGILFENEPVDVIAYAKKLKADAIHAPLYYFQEADLVTLCRKAGIKLRVWTVNDKKKMQMLAKAEIDAIITNYPDMRTQIDI